MRRNRSRSASIRPETFNLKKRLPYVATTSSSVSGRPSSTRLPSGWSDATIGSTSRPVARDERQQFEARTRVELAAVVFGEQVECSHQRRGEIGARCDFQRLAQLFDVSRLAYAHSFVVVAPA